MACQSPKKFFLRYRATVSQAPRMRGRGVRSFLVKRLNGVQQARFGKRKHVAFTTAPAVEGAARYASLLQDIGQRNPRIERLGFNICWCGISDHGCTIDAKAATRQGTLFTWRSTFSLDDVLSFA